MRVQGTCLQGQCFRANATCSLPCSLPPQPLFWSSCPLAPGEHLPFASHRSSGHELPPDVQDALVTAELRWLSRGLLNLQRLEPVLNSAFVVINKLRGLGAGAFATSSSSGFTGTSPMELDVLGRHNSACNSARTLWFGVRCALDVAGDFLERRFFTTLSICVAIGAVLAFLS